MLATAIEEALAAERRSARLVLRFSPADLEQLHARAAAAGLTRSECARALIKAGLAAQPEVAA